MKFICYLGNGEGKGCNESGDRSDDYKNKKPVDVEYLLQAVDLDKEDDIDTDREDGGEQEHEHGKINKLFPPENNFCIRKIFLKF